MKTPTEIEQLKNELKQTSIALENLSKKDPAEINLNEVERLKKRAEELYQELKNIFSDLEEACR